MADISLNYAPELTGQPGYGDLLFKNGDLVLTSDVDPNGTDPTLQDLTQRLSFFQGEWFWDTSDGVPWLQSILTKRATKQTVDTIFQETILDTPGVTTLVSYAGSYSAATRSYVVSFTYLSITGQRTTTTVPVTLPIPTGG